MGEAVKKRRSGARKKTQPASVLKFPEREPPHLMRQIVSILLFGAAAFWSLSLVGQELVRQGLFERNSLTGPLGRLIGTLLGGFFGWCALLPALGLLFLGRKVWKGEGLRTSVGALLAGSIGFLLSACTLSALFFGRYGGGSLGHALATPLRSLCSLVGALLVSSIVMLLSLALLSDITIYNILAVAKRSFQGVAHVVFVRSPVILYRAITISILELGKLLLATLGFLNRRPEPIVVPKPRLRKNTILESTEAAQLDHQDHNENNQGQAVGSDLSHVTVRRRLDDEKSRAARARRKARDPKEISQEGQEQLYVGKYEPPDLDLLVRGEVAAQTEDDEQLKLKSGLIESKLKDFGILGRVTEVHPGPVITLFEFEPAAGVKVGRISALADDLAMTLRAVSIRIIAPIPGRGTVGIEVPNVHRELVRLRDVLESQVSIGAESTLSIALGKDTYGGAVVTDIASMPHLLIAGATGTGKSVCINSFLISLLYRATPAELGLIMIDPKILELSVYDGIPHLRVPVVTSPKQARAVLDWAVQEMNRRYRIMQKLGVRSIDGYNRVIRGEELSQEEQDKELIELKEQHITEISTEQSEQLAMLGEIDGVKIDSAKNEVPQDPTKLLASIPKEQLKPLPKIVIVIDELADLMMTVGREVEELITRLAQKARAAGIHLIVATQRPSVDVITGLIKANFPCRLSFQVTSRIDSRTIIDCSGAEKLLGRGDMLFMPPGVGFLKRVHGAYVSDSEVKKVVSALKKGAQPCYDAQIMQACEKALHEDSEKSEGGSHQNDEEYDELYDKAVEIVMSKGQASTSMIQRAFRIGYNRAARIIELMERDGIVGPSDGSKPRQVLHRVSDHDHMIEEAGADEI